MLTLCSLVYLGLRNSIIRQATDRIDSNSLSHTNMTSTDVADKLPIYSLNKVITDFFALNTQTTRQQCDNLATHILQSTVSPVPIQGQLSYTVIGGSPAKIVQF